MLWSIGKNLQRSTEIQGSKSLGRLKWRCCLPAAYICEL